jgi:hypothetical protein
MAGFKHILLNPWSLYRLVNGGADRGSNIDDNLVKARDVGILPESYWPRSKGWRANPPNGWKEIAKKHRIDEFFDITTVDEFGTALLKGFCVVWGWRGHAVYAVDVIDENSFRYANSWHEDWGDKGFGTEQFRNINWAYGAWAIRSTILTDPDDFLSRRQQRAQARRKRLPQL